MTFRIKRHSASAVITGLAATLAIGAASAAAAQSPLRPAPFRSMSGGVQSVYDVRFEPLNNSRARGEGTLRLSADRRTLTVQIRAWGLEPNGVHVSHIHGLSQNGQPVDSNCPSRAQDSDRDGFVELAEGQVTYGPILVDFGNIDPDKDGRINFTTTINLTGDENIMPLDKREIVIHGMTVGPVGAGTPGEVDGTAGYKTVLPVLCGAIQPARF